MMRAVWHYGAILLAATFTASCLDYIWDHVEVPSRLFMAVMGAAVFGLSTIFLMSYHDKEEQ